MLDQREGIGRQQALLAILEENHSLYIERVRRLKQVLDVTLPRSTSLKRVLRKQKGQARTPSHQ
jgi:hypothetical protein